MSATAISHAGGDGFLYQGVERHVRSMIEEGLLEPGSRVPSLRRMSRQAGVSIATVTQAYIALEQAGLIEAREKSGFYVRERARTEPKVPRQFTPRATPRQVRVDDAITEIHASVQAPDILSLGLANPWPELLPVKGLARATTRVLARERAVATAYCFPPGAEALRRQIAFRLADLGCSVAPDEIVITHGATEALTAALNAVAERGDVIAVESPSYHAVLQIIERLGMLALEVRTDPDTGLDLEALSEALDQVEVKAVLCVPNFTNPLGALMPEPAKRALVELLAERSIPLIEDDVYGDLAFDAERPRIAKSYDEHGIVISCSSFSKTLAPGYRVGWVAPGRYGARIQQWKHVMSSFTATLPQLAVAEYLRGGEYDRHLRVVRRRYAEQVERMRMRIAEHFPEGTRVTRPRGGYVLWVELPRGSDAETLFADALAHGVSVMPGTLFSPTRKYRNFMRIACGRPWTDEVERAVQTLGRLCARRLE